MNCHSMTGVFAGPDIAPKAARRVLRTASEGLRGNLGGLGKPRDD